MGNRLSRIYTRTGDAGTTGLGDGSRVSKDALRVEAYGTVDELSSVLGLLLAEAPDAPLDAWLMDIQHRLFDLGGELCIPGHSIVRDAHVTELETRLDELNAPLGPLQDFILPGGTRAAALAHLARTVCRRAERRVVALMAQEAVNPPLLSYLNRLSDFLFVLARELNRRGGRGDILWQRERP